MLEHNTFRVMMMILGVIALALSISAMFVMRLHTVPEPQLDTYIRVMNLETEEANALRDDPRVTLYESLQFSMKASQRARIVTY